jgi:hypothetical protein
MTGAGSKTLSHFLELQIGHLIGTVLSISDTSSIDG